MVVVVEVVGMAVERMVVVQVGAYTAVDRVPVVKVVEVEGMGVDHKVVLLEALEE